MTIHGLDQLQDLLCLWVQTCTSSKPPLRKESIRDASIYIPLVDGQSDQELLEIAGRWLSLRWANFSLVRNRIMGKLGSLSRSWSPYLKNSETNTWLMWFLWRCDDIVGGIHSAQYLTYRTLFFSSANIYWTLTVVQADWEMYSSGTGPTKSTDHFIQMTLCLWQSWNLCPRLTGS